MEWYNGSNVGKIKRNVLYGHQKLYTFINIDRYITIYRYGCGGVGKGLEMEMVKER